MILTRIAVPWLLLIALLTLPMGWVSVACGQQLCVSRLPSLPVPLTNNAVTAVSNANGGFSLYSFTGITGPVANSQGATRSAYRFNSGDSAWSQISDAPGVRFFQNERPKIGANAITVNGSVYLLGGYSIPGAETTDRRLFRYDAVDDVYHQLSDVPTEVDDTVLGVYEDRYLYVVSGWHGPINDNVRDVQVYDSVTDEWQEATQIPGPFRGLFGHAGGLIGDRLVAFDGVETLGGNFTISDTVLVGQIDATDRTLIQWETMPAHPGSPTYRAAASQVATSDGRLLLVGGTDNPYNFNGIGYNGVPSQPLDQALLFDPVSGEWQSIAMTGDILSTMDHRGLVSLGADTWATIGGMDGAGTVTDQVVMYSLIHDGEICSVPEPGGNCLGLLLLFSLRYAGTRGRFGR